MEFIKRTSEQIQLSYIETKYKNSGSHKHFHEEYSIVYVTSGTHIFEDESAKYEIEEDVLRIINPYERHTTHNSQWSYINFMLPPEYINSIASNLYRQQVANIKFSSVIKDLKANELFKKLNKELKSVYPSQMEINILAIEFLEYLMKYYTLNVTYKNEKVEKYEDIDDDILDKAKKYIDENYSEKILLDDIANHVSSNKFHILREFYKKFNFTPYQYILIVRANKAKEMMLKKEPLCEVALSCGFTDQSNMVKNFKKIYNYTPSIVKRNIQEFRLES